MIFFWSRYEICPECHGRFVVVHTGMEGASETVYHDLGKGIRDRVQVVGTATGVRIVGTRRQDGGRQVPVLFEGRTMKIGIIPDSLFQGEVLLLPDGRGDFLFDVLHGQLSRVWIQQGVTTYG